MKPICDAQATYAIDCFLKRKMMISELELIKRAGRGLYRAKEKNVDYYLIICYLGNNGSDGLALAREIYDNEPNAQVFVYICCHCAKYFGKINENQKTLFVALKSLARVKIMFLEDDVADSLKKAQIIYDCLFGVGFRGKIAEPFLSIFGKVNSIDHTHQMIIACDVPSGMDVQADTIDVHTIHADMTVSFLTCKQTLIKNGSAYYTGKIIIDNLGLSDEQLQAIDIEIFKECHDFFNNGMDAWRRDPYFSKHDLGRALIDAGSQKYITTGVLVANMCLQAGAGLVYLLTDANRAALVNLNDEVIVASRDAITKMLADVHFQNPGLCFGPGKGTGADVYEELQNWLNNEYLTNILVDADGLLLLDENALQKCKNRVVITPHLYEFAHLLKMSPTKVMENRLTLTRDFAKRYNIIVVLKGYQTVVSDGDNVYVNSTGNSWMASAGMGDVLAGMICGFMGQSSSLLEATLRGVYWHGLTGDAVARAKMPVLASDVVANFGKVFANFYYKEKW